MAREERYNSLLCCCLLLLLLLLMVLHGRRRETSLHKRGSHRGMAHRDCSAQRPATCARVH